LIVGAKFDVRSSKSSSFRSGVSYAINKSENIPRLCNSLIEISSSKFGGASIDTNCVSYSNGLGGKL